MRVARPPDVSATRDHAIALRLAIVGFGMFGQRHARTIAADPGCVLAAVADASDTAARAAAGFGVTCWPDYAAMFDAVKPDGVVIATPNALHVPVAMAAVADRKSVV